MGRRTRPNRRGRTRVRRRQCGSRPRRICDSQRDPCRARGRALHHARAHHRRLRGVLQGRGPAPRQLLQRHAVRRRGVPRVRRRDRQPGRAAKAGGIPRMPKPHDPSEPWIAGGGPDLPTAFNRLWVLQRACEIQLAADSGGGVNRSIPDEILRTVPATRVAGRSDVNRRIFEALRASRSLQQVLTRRRCSDRASFATPSAKLSR